MGSCVVTVAKDCYASELHALREYVQAKYVLGNVENVHMWGKSIQERFNI